MCAPEQKYGWGCWRTGRIKRRVARARVMARMAAAVLRLSLLVA